MTINTKSNHKALILKTIDALNKNKFISTCFQTEDEAMKALLHEIPKTATVGIGGSETLLQLRIPEKLENRGNIIYNHNKTGLSKEEKLYLRRKELTCDVFLTSTNAITQDGVLVNTDATGNRVASMIFGPKKVIVIAGINKITPNIIEAKKRIQTIAAPLNNQRLNRPNPCLKTGFCTNCQLDTRLCNVTSVIYRQPTESNIHIWIIDKQLGY